MLLLAGMVVFINCYREQAVGVTADFGVTIENEDHSVPVVIHLENHSTGADHYRWTFEGGTPTSSNSRQPDKVTYLTAGTYIVRLEAWNDDQRQVKEVTLQLDSAMTIGFDLTIPVNNIAPVQALITNSTMGAGTYQWTFEGGQPASFKGSTPPAITYTEAGEYTLLLEISNGCEQLSFSKTITVLPAMVPDFDIIPAFEDQDMEAPLTAALSNKTSNGLTYLWTASGGTIAQNTIYSTSVYFATAGTYTVTLEAQNGKETKVCSKNITVLPNSNLYSMQDVQMGINAAHAEIGCFYSCALRRVVRKDEVTAQNAPLIDFAFFGLDETFRYARILSPDSVGQYAFADLPNPQHTAVVNLSESQSSLNFTTADFDEMTDDGPLRVLTIAAHDSGDAYFTGSVTPRMVLFQTANGRKGAIKIKRFVTAGKQSYIIADIKVQKESIF